jgi:hypothetical protein
MVSRKKGTNNHMKTQHSSVLNQPIELYASVSQNNYKMD